MKLLLDENISAKLVKFLTPKFSDSSHIDYLNMQGATDTDVWSFAKSQRYTIVSKDNDFRQRSFLFGSPPKVIWLSVGNNGTKVIKELILKNIKTIQRFHNNEQESLLILSL